MLEEEQEMLDQDIFDDFNETSADAIPSDEERLQRLLERAEKIRRSIQKEKARINEKKRKERNRRLIQVGGLAEIAGISTEDKGVLLGAFMEIYETMQHNPIAAQKWKLKGDSLLNRREQQRKDKHDDVGEE